MTGRRLTGNLRLAALAGACIALVAFVAYLDGLTSALIAFSIFYVVPIVIAAWYGNRTMGVAIAIASALGGLAADVWSIEVRTVYALTNLGCRLLLFILIAAMTSRIERTREREQRLAELERETTKRLQELNDMKDELMRSVIVDAREPLGDIYARIVTLGFDLPTLSVSQTRLVLNEIADASRRLSTMVNSLVPDEATALQSGSAARSPASSR
jgi:signal transduction histidine kinase